MYSSASGVCLLLSSSGCLRFFVGSIGETLLGVCTCVRGKSCPYRKPVASDAASATRNPNFVTTLIRHVLYPSQFKPSHLIRKPSAVGNVVLPPWPRPARRSAFSTAPAPPRESDMRPPSRGTPPPHR